MMCPICGRTITAENPLGEKDDVVGCQTCLQPRRLTFKGKEIAFDDDLASPRPGASSPYDGTAFDASSPTGLPKLGEETEQCLTHVPACTREDGKWIRAAMVPAPDLCAVCGKPLQVGQQGCIVRIVEHEPVGVYHPFIPYFDIALGEQVDSHAQRWRLMKQREDPATGEIVRERLEYRDKMSKGDLSARHDRIHERLVREGRERRG